LTGNHSFSGNFQKRPGVLTKVAFTTSAHRADRLNRLLLQAAAGRKQAARKTLSELQKAAAPAHVIAWVYLGLSA
jgi:hypothetical protein